MKKLVTIYVKPHIYKVLRRDYAYTDVLLIRRRFHIYTHTNTTYPSKFETPQDDLRAVRMEGEDMNIRKAYAIVRSIEAQFGEKMNIYVMGQVSAGKPARTAVRNFLEKYDILDEEFKVDSAYKAWQRFEADEKPRNRIPLWI